MFAEAERVADAAGVEFDGKSPRFFIGYWSRYLGQPRPLDHARAEGWDRCDRELRDEDAAQARSQAGEGSNDV